MRLHTNIILIEEDRCMRSPAVAGMFYPGKKQEIEEIVEGCFSEAVKKVNPVSAYAGIAPHAGYPYSGVPAATTFLGIKELEEAETVVIAGPNHTGAGELVALSREDWELPTGIVKNDREFGEKMAESANFLRADETAHRAEHSIEVQLPFLQHLNSGAKIVPVCMRGQGMEESRDVASAVVAAEKELGRKTVFIASSDFSHYVPAEQAKKEDHIAIEHILELDAEGFQNENKKRGWSICGYGPVSVAMLYAKARGSKKGLEVMYTNSGEATGDYSQVVAYASIIFPGGP